MIAVYGVVNNFDPLNSPRRRGWRHRGTPAPHPLWVLCRATRKQRKPRPDYSLQLPDAIKPDQGSAHLPRSALWPVLVVSERLPWRGLIQKSGTDRGSTRPQGVPDQLVIPNRVVGNHWQIVDPQVSGSVPWLADFHFSAEQFPIVMDVFRHEHYSCGAVLGAVGSDSLRHESGVLFYFFFIFRFFRFRHVWIPI